MSNTSLFNIGLDFRALYDLASEESYNEETGEIIDESETLLKLFQEVESTLSEKLDNTMYIIKSLEAEQTALKAEADRLAKRAKARENKAKFLKELMYSALNASGQQKLKTEKFNFSIKRSESVSIANEDELGREWVRIKREPNKTAIKKALKEGVEIEGCSISENFSIGVK